MESRSHTVASNIPAGGAQPRPTAESRLSRGVWFVRRVGYWVFSAPIDARRRRLGRLFAQLSTKTGLAAIVAWFDRRGRQLRRNLKRRAQMRAAEKAIRAPQELPCGYDVICLPVISWHSRFQRPQQLMRQFAARGHRVFYASLGFHTGAAAELAPIEPGAFEITLPGTPSTSVYRQLPSAGDVERMAAAIDRLRAECRIGSAMVVVQLPFWTALAEELRRKFGWPIVYDCMDDHSGFSTNCEAMLRAEERTITAADLVVVTSDLLHQKVESRARRTVLVRNACDYEHFAGEVSPLPPGEGQGVRANGRSDRPAHPSSLIPHPSSASPHPSPLPKGEGTKQSSPLPKGEGTRHPASRPKRAGTTVGFYGAIAEWFDADLVADLAQLRPDWNFQLIGNTFTGDVSRLEILANVTLLGEKPYADLPRLTADWDCFIIPFKRIPLTEATNPVKAYEMLATGKLVVAVDLPELRPMARQELLSLANDGREFAQSIERALAGDDPEQQRRRREFAAANTWRDRWCDLDAAVRELFPPASILVVTYNNLPLSKACLQSIFHQTEYPNYELIVVDNGSADGTPEWLAETARTEPRLHVICNRENRGFAAANNQALRQARGRFLCLLNNDTLVTRGWLSTLIGHLQKMPAVGLVGPVSNMVGNEAKIPVGYKQIADMPRWAADYCRQHDGETVPMIMLGFFCVMLRREVYETVGELDEQFGIGCFEDTDYCCRARRQGYELRCAHDAFVHHWQGAAFHMLGYDRYTDNYRNNQQLFEAKWGADSMAGAY